MALANPHGPDRKLKPLLPSGAELREERDRIAGLAQVRMTSRETSDLIMMGIGAFTPLNGFMGRADWQGVCDELRTADGCFWPIPITLSATPEEAEGWREGQEVALVDSESDELMGSLVIEEKIPDRQGSRVQTGFQDHRIGASRRFQGDGPGGREHRR